MSRGPLERSASVESAQGAAWLAVAPAIVALAAGIAFAAFFPGAEPPLRGALAVVTVLALAAALFVFVRSRSLGRRFGEPLDRLEATLDAVAAGDAAARVGSLGPDVPGRVAEKFDALLDRLLDDRVASLEQVRIDIPIIFVDVSYVGVAFPKLAFHEGFAPALSVQATGNTATTVLLADIDAVVALDFRNEFPTIVTKALISAAAKAAAGWAINDAARRQDEGLGVLARLVTMAVQAAVNIADTRCWSTLPKQFQVARLEAPPDRRILVGVPGRESEEVRLIDGEVVVVYVKSVAADGPLAISQFRLR